MASPTDGFQRIRYVSKSLLVLGLTVVVAAVSLYFGAAWLPL